MYDILQCLLRELESNRGRITSADFQLKGSFWHFQGVDIYGKDLVFEVWLIEFPITGSHTFVCCVSNTLARMYNNLKPFPFDV